MSSLCGNLSQPKFDVDMEQSPLLVVLYCNSPDFTKIKKNCFRCELFDCLICLRCLLHRFINRRLFFPLLSRIERSPPLAPRTLDLCATGFRPTIVTLPPIDQPQPTE